MYNSSTDTQLDDLKALRQTYRQNAYQTVAAERVGAATLRILHRRKSLLQRILGR